MKVLPDMPEAVGAVCPYCKQILDKRPQRKKKCPHCGEYIYVRTPPSGNGSRTLVTEEGAKEIDKEWNRLHYRKKWLQTLAQYGISDNDFESHREMLRDRFGQEPGDGDVVWSLFHKALDGSMKGGDLQEVKMLYFEMALFLYQEGRGFSHLLEQSRKMELVGYKEWGRPMQVEILAGGDSCESCKAQNGRILTVDEALKTMPLPNKGCTYELKPGRPGWCRCVYLPVLDS
jgi:predicted RNA-binding Zn-ribbon protein involved in translation (DUF1610 family)